MHHGLSICNHGDFADPVLIRDLAVAAEEAGWDGVFVWDHVARPGQPPMTDPWIALAAVACATSRVLLGPMVTPLPRRRPWKLARETVALDHLSGGRLVLGVGLGVHAEEFGDVGDEADPRVRAELLDDGLDLLDALWRAEPVEHDGAGYQVTAWHRPGPVQQPRIPIWVAGRWPARRPMARAARWDGAFPIGRDAPLTPGDVAEIVAFVEAGRGPDAGPFEVVGHGVSEPDDPSEPAALARAGMTWWLERAEHAERTPAEALARITAGPPAT